MHDGPDERERSGAPTAGSVDWPAKQDAEWPAEQAAAWPAEQDARERLRAIDDAPLEEHVEVYEDVHQRLQEGLADLDEG
jgi:hypothetical protein